MSRVLRIAVAQMGGVQLSESRREVVARLSALLREAGDVGARFVVFPELALTTFFPRYWFDDEAELDRFFETEMPSAETMPLFEEARRRGIAFYLGYAERVEALDKTRRFNTSILVNGEGRIVSHYRKIHLPGHSDHREGYPFQQLEKRYFEVGDLGFPVTWVDDALIGMAICNDRRWPETYRVLGLQGVELIALGYNTHDVNQYHRESKHLKMLHHFVVMQAGAYQNGTWLAAAGKTGDEDGHELIGGSCIIAPTGEIAAQTVDAGDQVITYTCDLDAGVNIRENRFNFAAHRRIEHYGLITSRVGAQAPPRHERSADSTTEEPETDAELLHDDARSHRLAT
jgi:predicted amidohydrolase